MHLEAARARGQRRLHGDGVARATPGQEQHVDGGVPQRLGQDVDVALRVGPDVPDASDAHADDGRDAGAQADLEQGRGGKVHMGVDGAGGGDEPLTRY